MRVTSLVAGLALVLAACGGEKKADEGTTMTGDTAAAPAAGEAAAPAATGATHDVNMVLEGNAYKFVPADLTVKPGDQIRYHNVSGGPHNVAFWQDSIPSGAASAITIADEMAPLTSQMVVEPNAVITVTVGGNAPAGAYKYYCQPHLALGMKGTVTVQQ